MTSLTEDQIDFAEEVPVELNASFQNKKILIVEDNQINQQVIMSFLKNIGCDVDLAENGIEAMSLTETNKYDVVLMDCQMPVMDGYEATREIRSREKETGQHLYIIAVTAHALNSEIEKCKIVGMDDYVSKPINMSNLKSALNKALHIQSNVQQLEGQHEKKSNYAFVDLNALKDLDLATAKANPKLILRLIEMFSENIDLKRKEMTEGLRVLDFKIVSARAHNLKSESGNLGCTKLSKLSGEIENLCSIQDKQRINMIYPEFLSEIDNCVKELTEIKRELESGSKPWAA